MTINWGALALVAGATITATMAIVGLFSIGVAAVTSGQRHPAGSEAVAGRGPASTPATVAGYSCIGVSGLMVLYGLYLIIPQFH